MLMMLPASRADARNAVRKDCDATSALLRCDRIIASQADSGYRSKRPVSSAASAGDDPSPALFTRIVGAPNRATTSSIARSTAARSRSEEHTSELQSPDH